MSDKNYVQVEIPKVPRWVADILSECQAIDYSVFKNTITFRCYDGYNHEKLRRYSEKNSRKNLDLAIALGVWQIEN